MLTNPQELRRSNPNWVKSVFTLGRCVSVTPQSVWKLDRREGDLALMAYAGTVGPPGSYYFSVADFVDSTGLHPGDAGAAPSASAANSSATDANGETGNRTFDTALAPDSQSAGASYAPPPSRSGIGTGEVLLALLIAGLAGGLGYLAGRQHSR